MSDAVTPRLLGRRDAQTYLGLGRDTFGALVDAGTLPPPLKLSRGRRMWDRVALDRAVDALSGIAADSAPDPEAQALEALRRARSRREGRAAVRHPAA